MSYIKRHAVGQGKKKETNMDRTSKHNTMMIYVTENGSKLIHPDIKCHSAVLIKVAPVYF